MIFLNLLFIVNNRGTLLCLILGVELAGVDILLDFHKVERVVIKRPYRENHSNSEGSRRVYHPNKWCKGKLDGVVGSVPPDKGCEVVDGELTHER